MGGAPAAGPAVDTCCSAGEPCSEGSRKALCPHICSPVTPVTEPAPCFLAPSHVLGLYEERILNHWSLPKQMTRERSHGTLLDETVAYKIVFFILCLEIT